MAREHIDIVFTGPPGPDPAECGFVEVEHEGTSLNAGEWLDRPDGYSVLRIRPDVFGLGPRKGNALPKYVGDGTAIADVLVKSSDWMAWKQAYRNSADQLWRLYEDGKAIDLSRVTHWMPVPEVSP